MRRNRTGIMVCGLAGLIVGCQPFGTIDMLYRGTTEVGTPFTVALGYGGTGGLGSDRMRVHSASIWITWYMKGDGGEAQEPGAGLGHFVLVDRDAMKYVRSAGCPEPVFKMFTRGDRLWLVRDSDGKVFAAVDLEQARAYRSPEPIPSWPAHGGVLVENHRPPPWDGSEKLTPAASER